MRRSVKFIHKTGSRVTAILAASLLFSIALYSQEMVDKTVASINDGARTELITYSEIMWELALQPNAPLDPPRPDDLNAALLRLIDQRLFGLEAGRLPIAVPTDIEIKNEIDRTLKNFPSAADFEARLKRVGFESIKDDNFERIIAERLSINNYIDFRFRSFTVITPEDEAKYFREVFTPDFRKRYQGLLMPTLDEKRNEIKRILIEQKVALRIESFLDDAKRRVEIEIISKP